MFMFGGRTTEKCADCQKYNFLWCKYFSFVVNKEILKKNSAVYKQEQFQIKTR